MIPQDLEQGSPEWLQARVGSLGASRLADALATTKSGWGASRANLIAELVAEQLTLKPAERFLSPEMRWGTEKEPEARAAYEWFADAEVRTVGLVPHPSIAKTHASPDGLVGDVGLVEIKCPNTATHIETLLGASVPQKYVLQMTWQMICTGREWCDFVSFDPRMPLDMQLFVKRLYRPRDDDADKLTVQVVGFLHEVDAKVDALENLFSQRAAA